MWLSGLVRDTRLIFEVFPVPFRRCNLCIVTDCTISHCNIKEPEEKGGSYSVKGTLAGKFVFTICV